MQAPPADPARAPASFPEVHCPYCDFAFTVGSRAAGGQQLPRPKEFYVLPYARDVALFDPDPRNQGKHNSDWTRIGTDFFAGINYERIGILHMEEGWDVRYSAARCPRCRKLMDLFANLTPTLTLSEMWPHLLARDPAQPERGLLPWQPTDVVSRALSQSFGVWFLLIALCVISLLPEFIFYSHQPVFDSARFARVTLPIFLLRGLMVGSLGYLLLLRRKMIALFSDIDSLGELLKINRDGLVYWSNFAVNRFTGYQKKGKRFPINAVTLLGGFLSVLILVASWLTVRFFASGFGPLPSLPVMATELGFWMCMAAGFGVIAWNFSVIPVYVLEGAKNIPIRENRWT